MRFLSIYKTAERNTPPTQQEMDTMGKLIEEGMKAGWLLATEGCLPTALGCQTSREAEISVRLRFMGSYRGKLHPACPCVLIWRAAPPSTMSDRFRSE